MKLIHKSRRAVSRFFFHTFRLILKIFEAVTPRFYMAVYLPILSFYGIKLHGQPRYISSTAKFDDFNKIELGDRTVISARTIFFDP